MHKKTPFALFFLAHLLFAHTSQSCLLGKPGTKKPKEKFIYEANTYDKHLSTFIASLLCSRQQTAFIQEADSALRESFFIKPRDDENEVFKKTTILSILVAILGDAYRLESFKKNFEPFLQDKIRIKTLSEIIDQIEVGIKIIPNFDFPNDTVGLSKLLEKCNLSSFLIKINEQQLKKSTFWQKDMYAEIAHRPNLYLIIQKIINEKSTPPQQPPETVEIDNSSGSENDIQNIDELVKEIEAACAVKEKRIKTKKKKPLKQKKAAQPEITIPKAKYPKPPQKPIRQPWKRLVSSEAIKEIQLIEPEATILIKPAESISPNPTPKIQVKGFDPDKFKQLILQKASPHSSKSESEDE